MGKTVWSIIFGSGSFQMDKTNEIDAFAPGLWALAGVASAISLLVAFLLVSNVKNEGGASPKEHVKRRRIFVAIGIIALIILALFTSFVVPSYIKPLGPLLSRYGSINFQSLGLFLFIYYVGGLGSSLLGKGKWATLTRKKTI
ncbi:MAG: hypothetical protein SF053_00600 [Bacteroidia bacterium]|nr:hypothetical protein [Bacteroidia bacterium]